MQKTIVILSSGHSPFDERIFWKFGRSLLQIGFKVIICTSTEDTHRTREGIIIDSFQGKNMKKRQKVNYFKKRLSKYTPDLIICCEPMTIVPSYRYKKEIGKGVFILSDITEWYPENYTSKLKGLRKYSDYILLWLFNIYTVQRTDALIIGEPAKKKRYNFIAPLKKKIIIGYYPILEFFKYSPPRFEGKKLTLCYAGLINFKRGILTMLDICKELKNKYPNLSVVLKIAGKFENEYEEKQFIEMIRDITAFKVEVSGWKEYTGISEAISCADICLDLRVHSYVYNNSLPIKVFEYMAAGKPFIFSDIKPLRRLLGNQEFAHLVEPGNIPEVLEILDKYINDQDLLLRHSARARAVIDVKYNWETESVKLAGFIKMLTGE